MAEKTATEIRNILLAVYGGSSPSFLNISFWVWELKCNRTSTYREPRSGHLTTSTNAEMVDKIDDIVLANHRLKLKETAETTSISEKRFGHILRILRNFRYLWGQWISRLTNIQRNPSNIFIFW